MVEKTVQLKNKFFVSTIIVLFCFLLDRVSKVYIIDLITNNDGKDYYINEFINFTLIWNKGIAFGLLESETLFYKVMSILILTIIIFLIYLIVKSNLKKEVFCLSIIVGGALGNLYDRFYYNSVPDFIDIHYLGYHWFIFNVSDILITLAILLLILFDIKFFKEKKND